MKGPKTSKLGHVTQATPNYESFYDLYAGEVGIQCLYQILSGQLYSFYGSYAGWVSPLCFYLTQATPT